MALDLNLSYAQVAFKASHNSYARDELPISTQFADLGDTPAEGRCRGIELDLNPSGRNWLWSVNHVGGYDGSADQQLSIYLADLSRWHKAHPDHHVVTVTLDLKGEHPLDKDARRVSDFSGQLDAALKDAFPEAIFRPRDLQGNESTLIEGAANWPSLKALAGTFVFFLSGSGDLKRAYSAARDADACCFLDRTFRFGDRFTPEAFPDTVFYNFDVDAWSAPERLPVLKQTVRQIAEDGRCIVRGYVINTSLTWKLARDAGFSILTTDKVRGHDWASVGPEPFAPRLRPTRAAREGRGGRSTRKAAAGRRKK